ncbi:unnamed protein product [Phaeothamnion confervicola]
MKKFLNKHAVQIGVFSHAPANNDNLKSIQRELAGCDTGRDEADVFELIRRNDTRWNGNHAMLDRTLRLEAPIKRYFSVFNPGSARCLTNTEWALTREVVGVLNPVLQVQTGIQGGENGFLSDVIYRTRELREVASPEDDKFEVRPARYGDANESKYKILLQEDTSLMIDILAQQMGDRRLGMADREIERLAILLDPRRKKESGCIPAEALGMAEGELLRAFKAMHGDGGAGGQPPTMLQPPRGTTDGQPPAKKVKMSALERRRAEHNAGIAQRRDAADGVGADNAADDEVGRYLRQELEMDVSSFSLFGYWREKSCPKLDGVSGEVLAKAEFPKLARLAALYLCVEGTS